MCKSYYCKYYIISASVLYKLSVIVHSLTQRQQIQSRATNVSFIIYGNTATCFGCTQAINRLYSKLRDSWYTTCIKLTYGKMKCELHLLLFNIHGPLKCLYLCLLWGWIKAAVYLNIIRRRAIVMQYICF